MGVRRRVGPLLVGLLIGAVLAGLTACGGPVSNAGPERQADATNPISGTVQVVVPAVLSRPMQEWARRFGQVHPHATVTVGTNDTTDLNGVSADVIGSTDTSLAVLARAGEITPPVAFAKSDGQVIEMAVVLASNNPSAAQEFLSFIQEPEQHTLLVAYGLQLP